MAEETKPPVALAPGSPAPQFSLPGKSGHHVSLGDFAGKNVVLVYFYPKDDTPGCTKEACSLRDGWSALQAAGVAVLGISRDGADSHAAFVAKYNLPFELLTDADHAVHEAYGAWGQNPNPIWGIGPLRKSFLVGKNGNILHVFTKVDTEHHAEQVLKALGAPAPEAAANVGGAVKEVVEAAKKVVGEVRKTETVRKAETAVANAETAVAKAVDDVKKAPAVQKATKAVQQAVADVKKAPAVQKAAKAVRKAVADAKKKPSVKKATKAVKKAVAQVKAQVKDRVKQVKKAFAGKKKAVAKKAPPKKAASKTVKKSVKKAVKKVAKKAPARKPARASMKKR